MLTKVGLTAETLAAVFEQSADCVKLIGIDGKIRWMNENGLCTMEIDDLGNIVDRDWSDMWPVEVRGQVQAGLIGAATGNVVRFDAPCPTAKGNAKWWNVCVSRVDDGNKNPVGYLAVSRDITDIELARQALEISVEEMRHRIRNTYAMIGGLLAGYAIGNPEREQFALEMQARLVAISKAQTMFSSDDAPTNLATLIPALIAPFQSERTTVTVADIANLDIDQGRADAIALVLGELAVNASKHGALAAGGSIAVMTILNCDGFEIRWHERSVAAVKSHSRDGGQGLKLIESIVRSRGGKLDIEWQANGPIVKLAFPLADQ